LFGTLQDRLVKELRLAGITNVAAANVFLRDVFLPAFNTRFCVVPRSDTNAHQLRHRKILCVNAASPNNPNTMKQQL